MNRFKFAIAAALALAPVSLAAEAIEERAVIAGKVKHDPAMGYIFLHAENRSIGQFMRVPDAEDLAKFQQDWKDGLAEAREKYAKDLARWERNSEEAAKLMKKPPERPEEPTESTFSIGTPEQRNMIGYGPIFMFSKAGEPPRFSFMMSVKPGTYIYYGPVNFVQDIGMVGPCFCMGTLRFEVKAGTIANLGNFLAVATRAPAGWPETAIPEQRTLGSGFGYYKVNVRESASEPSFDLPDSLTSWPSEIPDFRASGKMNNFQGVIVSRMPPVPGILAYDRDKVIDVKAVAAETLEP